MRGYRERCSIAPLGPRLCSVVIGRVQKRPPRSPSIARRSICSMRLMPSIGLSRRYLLNGRPNKVTNLQSIPDEWSVAELSGNFCVPFEAVATLDKPLVKQADLDVGSENRCALECLGERTERKYILFFSSSPRRAYRSLPRS